MKILLTAGCLYAVCILKGPYTYESSCKMSGSKTLRIELGLQKKIELIKSKKACRNLAADFNIASHRFNVF